MEILLGFAIALAISLTGVGAGIMTTPLLIVLLGVSPTVAVGTSLSFGAITKIASVPAYALRRQVNFRILGVLLLGGIPGVLAGALLLDWLKRAVYASAIYEALGLLIVFTALFRMFRVFRPKPRGSQKEKRNLLMSCALPIGAEVGFSAAGAGALGSLLLLTFTRLTAAEVVGTDLCFGLGLSAVGGLIHVGAGNYDGPLLLKLVIGGVFGAITGSMLAGRIAQKPLTVALLIVLFAIGCQLALHGHSPAPPIHAVLQALNR